MPSAAPHPCAHPRCGALVRVGRELVVLGGRYSRWLERQATNVPGFEIAPNRPSGAA